jgi:DNA-binding Lrp family transcriptional regulator
MAEEASAVLQDLDKKLMMEMQDHFPLSPRPFKELADRLGIPEEEVIERTRRLQAEGMIRRIGPILDVRRVKGRVGSLIGMKVPEDRLEEVAKIVNQFREVSHNYVRNDEYNVWFTISARGQERFNEILDAIKRESGIDDILVLSTKRYFKLSVRFDLERDL